MCLRQQALQMCGIIQKLTACYSIRFLRYFTRQISRDGPLFNSLPAQGLEFFKKSHLAGLLMNRIKCLIIDDEPTTARVLEAYISELDSLELAGTFYSAVEALMYLQQNKIDLLFLDIMLPQVTGDAFLRMLPSRPRVIFVSSRRRKWKPGADDHILGCLMKPVAFEDFLVTIDRFYETLPAVMRHAILGKPKRGGRDRGPFVYFFSGPAMVKVYLDEVMYVEGVKNHCKFTTTENEIIIHQGLTPIAKRLAGKGFMRIHRALVVAIDRITAFTDDTLEINGHILPVSAPYRGHVSHIARGGRSGG